MAHEDARRRLPWGYVDGTNIPQPGYSPNLPTPEGAELGELLAGFVDREYCRTGRDTRCEDCAFRKGTPPNQAASTLMNAVKCLYEGEPFHCHVHDRICGGYAALGRTPPERK